jgi:hypothetical protein
MILTLDQFTTQAFYLENQNFYDSILNSSKSLINNKDGFIIYMYEFKEETFDSHNEFEFFPNKLTRISKTATEIKELNFEGKLAKGLEELALATRNLVDKQGINTLDLDVFESILSDVTESIFKNGLSEKIAKLKIEISDLQRNLPQRSRPLITDSFLITSNEGSNSISINDLIELPVEMKRHNAMNGLILPKTIQGPYAKVWTGFKPAPMVGHGTVEIWEKVSAKWKCISKEITWVS